MIKHDTLDLINGFLVFADLIWSQFRMIALFLRISNTELIFENRQ